jgi:hypothetical protein
MTDLRLLAGAVFLSAAGDLLALVTLALLVHDLTGTSSPSRPCSRRPRPW